MPFSSVDFPVSPRKFPFFYGWAIVGAGTLGILSSIPGQTMGVSVFTEHLMDAVGLTRMQISIAYGAGTVCSGFLLTQGGMFIDRIGVRRMIVLATILLSISLVMVARSGDITNALIRIVGEASRIYIAMAVMFLSFFMLRFWGQGMLALTPRVMIGKWFDRRRGLAIGIAGVFVSFGFGTSPIALNLLIERLGWQGAYYLMAGVIGIGVSLAGWVFYRERPEDCGLLPDGASDTETHAGTPGAEMRTQRDFSLAEVIRSYPFWVFTLGLSSQGIVVTAATFHILSLSESAGITGAQGLAMFFPMSLILVTTNLTAGWLSDKTQLKYFLMVMMVMQSLGTCGLMFLGEFGGRAMFIVGFGMSGGIFGTLIGTAWPRFYGLAHLGAISGLNMSVMVMATSVGPLLFAGSLDWTGSYTTGILICLIVPAIVFFGAFRANNPQKTL
ncbi:MAG: MFS transporter [Candidatus Hydrogenedentes bacterium]|nr:MFS transporter [Candidatus Hydrogenedentota bacterium]